jgi:hypothetical protein
MRINPGLSGAGGLYESSRLLAYVAHTGNCLVELLSRVTPENIHLEIDFGQPIGFEVKVSQQVTENPSNG